MMTFRDHSIPFDKHRKTSRIFQKLGGKLDFSSLFSGSQMRQAYRCQQSLVARNHNNAQGRNSSRGGGGSGPEFFEGGGGG